MFRASMAQPSPATAVYTVVFQSLCFGFIDLARPWVKRDPADSGAPHIPPGQLFRLFHCFVLFESLCLCAFASSCSCVCECLWFDVFFCLCYGVAWACAWALGRGPAVKTYALRTLRLLAVRKPPSWPGLGTGAWAFTNGAL